jgi:uncharacterized protein YhdP
MTGTVDLQAKGLKLETAAQCLTHGEILLTGSFDLQAKLSTRGKPADFLRNLSGTVQARAQNGHVRKFALLGNIMTVRDVIGMLGPNRPTFEGDGFPYRAITAQANLTGGLIRLQQSGFDSSALGLAATGTINLVDGDTRMSVLVAPFSRLDRIVRSVPVIGYIFGGALTSIPVGVSGDIRNPIVVPLGPGAITNELLGIFERTLKLPAELVKPLQPGAPPSGSAAPP